METDALGRLYVSDEDVAKIRAALATIPDGKRAALLVVADQNGVRGHVAALLDSHWKVAAGIGAPWHGSKPEGFVSVQAVW